jgi:hypothetical protein
VELTKHNGREKYLICPDLKKEVMPMSANEDYSDFVKSTGYGTGGGLCGWN